MAIEERPGSGGSGASQEGHLTGSPSIDAEWSGGDAEELPRPVNLKGNPHGKLSSWLVVITALLAFAVAGVALIFKAWIVIWICVAIIALMIPVGFAVRIMDDTVGWARPTPGEITRGDMTRTATKVRDEELKRSKGAHRKDEERTRR
jgi:hypothetical protein